MDVLGSPGQHGKRHAEIVMPPRGHLSTMPLSWFVDENQDERILS